MDPSSRLDILVITQHRSVFEQLQLAVSQVEDEKISLFQAPTIPEGLKMIYGKPFDAAIVELGHHGAFDISHFAQFAMEVPFLPIVTLVNRDALGVAKDALLGGAQDWLGMESLYPELVQRSLRYAGELHRMKETLRSMSLIDAMTGLYNKTGLHAIATPLMQVATRSRKPALLMSVDVLDLDDVQERHGAHEKENAILRASQVIWKAMRGSDIVARTGTAEFAIYAGGASPATAHIIVDRIKHTLKKQRDGERWPFTFRLHVGYVELTQETDLAIDDLIRKARVLAS